MGATGPGPFDNDDALDFLDELEESDPAGRRALIESRIGEVVRGGDYVEAPLMAQAIAGAVLVAACDDIESVVGERNVPAWVDDEPLDVDDRLEELATRLLNRAMKPDDNELFDLWAESDGGERFTARLTHYLDALGE
ncbi:protein of unknown function [Pedococcus dokdonensis]|uniref:DUF4259 domain-containing protein n=1 Tax=Pedococcus dokdonensis TaxID=443156 RepID=A0A1H0MBV4_9MICO|nr:DUF4259 domain-containing protein [Pedococcus dokdonensis]SDO77919.1 protein of unknown function [Pedococcus dokdonensis]